MVAPARDSVDVLTRCLLSDNSTLVIPVRWVLSENLSRVALRLDGNDSIQNRQNVFDSCRPLTRGSDSLSCNALVSSKENE